MNYILPISLAKYIIFKSLMVRTKKLAITWVAYHGTFVSLKSIKYLILVLLSNFNSISCDCIHISTSFSHHTHFLSYYFGQRMIQVYTRRLKCLSWRLFTVTYMIVNGTFHVSFKFFFSVLIVFLTLLVFSF